MDQHVAKSVVEVTRREHLVVDKPTLDNITASDAALLVLCDMYNLTRREAEILWLLRANPVDLSLIPSLRTHLYSIRKKLKPFNLEIKSLWRGVYELSIVGD